MIVDLGYILKNFKSKVKIEPRSQVSSLKIKFIVNNTIALLFSMDCFALVSLMRKKKKKKTMRTIRI